MVCTHPILIRCNLPLIQDERQTMFFQTREKVMKIWQELEIEPQGGFEQLVASGDVRNFTFSLANMQMLKEFYQKVGPGME